MKYEYPALAHSVIDAVSVGQGPAIDEAIALIAPRLRRGGVLHVFGTGHARIPMHEMAGRAGGLAPVNLVRLSDLVFRGGHEPAELADPLLERDPEWAAPLLELVALGPDDVFLLASNSGINGVIVEFARLVHEAGFPVVALTSIAHSTSVPSRHPAGLRLLDLADVVIDNGAPAGDAALELRDSTAVGAVSNLAGVVVVQILTEGIARAFLAEGEPPLVFRSMNLPDGDARNADPLAAYAGRVHPIEP
ncbi:sugar isomerase domain-containing protein [Microbacterium sp.]|uniref:sugar isomerase domain-containing protein n=1 Tax=Microbacterium sp. TaxID=51671 RepID=UPI003F9B4A4B